MSKEREGFEPSVIADAGFQNQDHKPLGHLSLTLCFALRQNVESANVFLMPLALASPKRSHTHIFA